MPKRALATLAVAFFVVGHLSAQTPDAKTLRIEPVESPAEVITPGGTGWALLAGVGQYPAIEGGSISSLRAPANDVDALYGFLTDPQKGGFNPENVRRLKDRDATKDAIGIELTDIANKATANDLVVIYFSGHGFRPDGSGTEGAPAYLIPYLTHPRALVDPAGTCIDYAELARKVRSMAAEKVVTILDACHAGGVRPAGSKGVQHEVYGRFYAAWEEAQGRPLLLSSDASEVSWEEEGGSVFTNFLLRGLEGEADANGDAIVGFNEVAAYLEREVPAYTRSKFPTVQTPTRRYEHGPVRGDIPLAVNLERHQAIQDEAVATRDTRNQAILLGGLDPQLEDLSLQVISRAFARETLDDHETALLKQLDGFAAGTVTKADYVVRAQAISGTVPPGLPSREPSTATRPRVTTDTPADTQPIPTTPRTPTAIAYPSIPRGVRVVVDDVPTTLPHELPPGEHTIQMRRDGYRPIDITPHLRAGETFTLRPTWQRMPSSGPDLGMHAPAVGPSPGGAFAASLLLPGLGQHRNGNNGRGVAYEVAIALAGATAVAATVRHRRTLDDYESIRSELANAAPRQLEFNAQLQEIASRQEDAYSEAESARKLAVASQIAVAILWGVNALDSARGASQQRQSALTLGTASSPSGPVAALSLRF